MRRRVMTEKEKREYQRQASHRESVLKRIAGHGRKRALAAAVAAVVLLLCISGYIFYAVNRPDRLEDLFGTGYSRVEWSGPDTGITVEDTKGWAVEKAFPGSLDGTAPVEGSFYREDGELAGNITLMGDNFFLYGGQIYRYTKII